jgi:alcohol dehydrogenase class IV
MGFNWVFKGLKKSCQKTCDTGRRKMMAALVVGHIGVQHVGQIGVQHVSLVKGHNRYYVLGRVPLG